MHPGHALPFHRRAVSRRRPLAIAVVLMLVAVGWHDAVLAGSGAKAAQASAQAPATTGAPVKVDGAWVRATVKGQTASGGFMSLTSSRDLTLVGFSTQAAGQAELHDMVMEGDVMRMRAIDSLPLPAGQAVTLKPGPGGKHLMLMDLKRQLKEGEEVVLKLRLRTADGKALTQEVAVPVRRMQMAVPAQPPSTKGAEGTHAQ